MAVCKEGVANGVKAIVVELDGVIEEVAVFILRIEIAQDFFV